MNIEELAKSAESLMPFVAYMIGGPLSSLINLIKSMVNPKVTNTSFVISGKTAYFLQIILSVAVALAIEMPNGGIEQADYLTIAINTVVLLISSGQSHESSKRKDLEVAYEIMQQSQGGQ